MAPKRAQKMSLNEFLGDSGSWADEMESLPSAPAIRTEEERANDRFSRRDDFLSSRPDRATAPPREDLPLPTQPPYTAFIGNLAFDLTETELEDFFGPSKTKTIKIIKDRDEKPKGFGYIEFVELEGLKSALTKSGSSFSGRTIRVSVAEPPKERTGFTNFDDEAKFDNPWRRDGPLPDASDSRDIPRRRFDGPPSGTQGLSEGASDWRSSRSRPPAPDHDVPVYKRKSSAFSISEGAADKEDAWTLGGKFKPATGPISDENHGPKFGSIRGKDSGSTEEGDWRNMTRPKPIGRNSTSPSNSTPPTPQISRRKLELLPRSGGASASPSPLSSPRLQSASVNLASRPSPFGGAKPVDVSSKEQEVAERLAKEREANKERINLSMSRTNSRTASDRSPHIRTKSPPPTAPRVSTPSTPNSPKHPSHSSNIRPSLSFANVASSKESADKCATSDENPVGSLAG